MPIARWSATPVAVVLAGSLLMSACLISRGDPTRFYTLSTVAETPASRPRSLALGLGPITMPGYLRRPTLATRVDTNEVRYDEFARWAEPLASQFERTLGQDVAILLGTDRVLHFPWAGDTPLDVVVRVDVLSFETDAHGAARLEASWTIREPRTGAVRHGDKAVITEPLGAAGADGADAAVGAMSRAVGQLAQRIVAAVALPYALGGSR